MARRRRRLSRRLGRRLRAAGGRRRPAGGIRTLRRRAGGAGAAGDRRRRHAYRPARARRRRRARGRERGAARCWARGSRRCSRCRRGRRSMPTIMRTPAGWRWRHRNRRAKYRNSYSTSRPRSARWMTCCAPTLHLAARVYEVHPEVAFWRLNGERALDEPKKVKSRPYPPGLGLRRRLLEAAGLPSALVAATPPKGAAADDAIDALACAAIARRLRGLALPIPRRATPTACRWRSGPSLLFPLPVTGEGGEQANASRVRGCFRNARLAVTPPHPPAFASLGRRPLPAAGVKVIGYFACRLSR